MFTFQDIFVFLPEEGLLLQFNVDVRVSAREDGKHCIDASPVLVRKNGAMAPGNAATLSNWLGVSQERCDRAFDNAAEQAVSRIKALFNAHT